MTQPPPASVRDALPVQPAKSRILITLVVDTSSSMAEGDRIGELNRALRSWREELMGDDHLSSRGEIALVTFGKDHVVAVDPSGAFAGHAQQPYVPVSQFKPAELEAGGVTPMVEALQYAFDLLATRRQQLRADGIPLANRPLVYLITDGVPTDERGYRSDRWRDFAPVIRQHEDGKHLLFFALGVDGAERQVLAGLAPSSWQFLAGLNFAQVLSLVSSSIESASAASARNEPADEVYRRVQEHLDLDARMTQFLQGNG